MTKSEITKKTSTPTYPPEIPLTPAWKRTTRRTATARSPSTSGPTTRWSRAVPDLSPTAAASSRRPVQWQIDFPRVLGLTRHVRQTPRRHSDAVPAPC